MSQEPAGLEAARQAKSELAERLVGDERIAGIGIAPDGAGGYQVKVNLAKPEPGLELPAEVAGVPVRTEVVGEIRPL
ncbi:hypothetical protein BH18ACT7_BH18ACT7_05910 [soil metagenome]